MALGKSIATGFGVAATYWKIANVTKDFLAGAAKVVLAGYVSSEARAANAAPLASAVVDLSGDSFGAEDTRADLYEKVHARTEWADAIDC